MSDPDRPNPEALLARVRATEAASQRGKLRIFLGYAAGVGKTYAMLEAAQRERERGTDIVVGYVEPHGRVETEALLKGLELIPNRQIPYQGVMVREFDLDAVLKRRPRIALVDELAHTNALGSRHAKRWQDVEELLDAGIDIWTTLNVQHIESLNDVIAQISGVIVRETLPDSVLEQTDEFEIIDLSPEDLIERLKAGKVYVPAQAQRALQNFFQETNLTALRELSLRQGANRLRRDVDAAHREQSATEPWASGERLLVCVSPSPTTTKLIRTARRMAASLGAEWLAVAVHTGSGDQAHFRQAISQHFRLAEQLGGETQVLVGEDVADTLLQYARERNVTKIVVGKTAQPAWKRVVLGTLVDRLIDRSGDIDIYLIRGGGESSPSPKVGSLSEKPVLKHYLYTAAIVALSGLTGWLSHWQKLAEVNIVMLFLLGVVFAATWFGRGPAIFAAIANVLVFDFFFVPPYLSFSVGDVQYLFTFVVMLGIGLLISNLTARMRDRLLASQRQERRTVALYRLTRQLSEMVGVDFLVRSAGQRLSEMFSGLVVIFVRNLDGQISLRFGGETTIAKESVNAIVAQWVSEHDQTAGLGTDTLPNATALFVPLIGSRRTVGAIGIRGDDATLFNDPAQRRLLETCASMIALSIERDQSNLEAHQAQLQVETEQLRNSLLSSVSHDLRTPLAAIAGASSELLRNRTEGAVRQELLQSIVDESSRLTRLVDNLLDMTRLEAGQLSIHREWHVLEEIVGSALHRLRRELADRPVELQLPQDLPMIWVDGLLMEQLLVNLLENALRYTPAKSPIEITAKRIGSNTQIVVADHGPGLPEGSEQRMFEKFFRGTVGTADSRRGVGLGLAICLGIAQAHGGQIRARNRPSGGAEFTISLPSTSQPPRPDAILAPNVGEAPPETIA